MPATARSRPPASITGQVLDQLRRSILSGEAAPGDPLRQEDLCARFGVSPAPVREALRRLESEGLVEHHQNRGVFVLPLGREELVEVVIPTRLLLERFALQRAVATDRAALTQELTDVVARMAVAAEAGDAEGVNDTDVEFHEVIIRRAAQTHTSQLWRSITPRLRAEFARLAPAPPDLHVVVGQHERYLEAIVAGSRARLRAELVDHAQTSILALLQERAGGRRSA